MDFVRVLGLLTLFALFLALPVFALEFNPKNVGALDADVSLSWSVQLPDSLPSQASFTSYAFEESPFQHVDFNPLIDCDPACTLKTDAEGNRIVEFAWTPTSSTQTLRFHAVVHTDERAFKPIPAPAPSAAYTEGSRYVTFFPESKSLAQTITAPAVSDEERLVLLTDWVNHYVKYEGVGYRDILLTSSEVYQAKSGKCSEYAHLLLALLRELNIPARFVAGLVFTGDEWGAHAWVEAYVNGRWVPLDPTYGEALVLDGTHLKFAQATDQAGVSEVVRVTGFNVDASRVQFTRTQSVNTLAHHDFKGLYSLSVTAPQQSLGPGSLVQISARLDGGAKTLAVPLSLSVPKELTLFDSVDRLTYLPAGATRDVEWRGQLPTQLETGYRYNYSAEVSGLGQQVSSSFIAQSGGEQLSSNLVALSSLSYSLSDRFLTVRVRLQNKGTQSSVVHLNVALGGQTRGSDLELTPGEFQDAAYDFPRPTGERVTGTVALAVDGATSTTPIFVDLSAPPASAPLPSPSSFASGIDLTSLGASDALFLGVLVFAAVVVIWRVWRGHQS